MKIRLVFTLIALMMLAGTAGAATITVCVSGCDYTTDGVADEIEIQYAIDNASANDVVFLSGSSYNTTSTINLISDITLSGNSTLGTTITHSNSSLIMLEQDYGVDNVTIHDIIGNTSYILGDTNNELIHIAGNNTLIYNYQDATHQCNPQSINAQGINTEMISNITIRDSIFSRAVFYGYMNGRLADNYIFNNTWKSPVGCSASGKQVGNLEFQVKVSNLNVYNNTILASNPYGLRIHGGATSNNNTVYDNNITSMSLDSGQDTLIFNNTILTRVDITDQGTRNNITIRNNIFRNMTGRDCIKFSHDQVFASNMSLLNNIFYGCGLSGLNFTDSDINITVKNNIFYDYGSGYSGINYISGNVNASYNMIYTTGTQSNYTGTICSNCVNQTDPLFNDTSIFDFHLKSQYGRWNGSTWVIDASTSPAIDAGNPTSVYSNEPEPNGDRINMGAYGNTIYASKSITTDVPPSIPGIPINIASVFGKYYINTTWSAGEGNVTTDSYNVSVNGTWYNGTAATFFNNTGIQNLAWSNVTVFAWNNTGNGNLSTSSVNLSTQLILYSISGYVTDSNGIAVSLVSVTNSDGSSNTTNAAGYYIISDQLNGSYSLSFSKSGYVTNTLLVTVSGTNLTNQNIVLTATTPTTWSELEDQVPNDWATWTAVMGVAIIISIIAIVFVILNSGNDVNVFQLLAIAGIVLAILVVLFGIIPVIGYNLDTAFDGMVR